jgi:N-acetyl-gamma-glutamyl-phosphate reductase
MSKVGIIGATGYVGYEITRLLQKHPNFEITNLVSQSFVGKKYSDVYPNLRGILDMECTAMDIDSICSSSDIVITALPHGLSSEVVPKLLEKGKKVLDHSGDYRYKDISVYEKWYKTEHKSPYLLQSAVYGLPEIYREKIKSANLVSNPGCYPTCSILALAPLLANNVISLDNIILDAVSGVTGAGRSTDLPLQFCECTENFKAYGVTKHRHTSEIEQEVSSIACKDVILSFTPHLAPFKRGMLVTTYANLLNKSTTKELIELYKEHYKNEFFVRVLDEGKLPETKFVAGSNFIDIGLVVDERLNRVIILSALDNLGKGASSQALQSMNIMFGYDEKSGLDSPGLYI